MNNKFILSFIFLLILGSFSIFLFNTQGPEVSVTTPDTTTTNTPETKTPITNATKTQKNK